MTTIDWGKLIKESDNQPMSDAQRKFIHGPLMDVIYEDLKHTKQWKSKKDCEAWLKQFMIHNGLIEKSKKELTRNGARDFIDYWDNRVMVTVGKRTLAVSEKWNEEFEQWESLKNKI